MKVHPQQQADTRPYRHSFNGILLGTYTRPIEGYVSFRMTSSDLEYLSEIFNDTNHRAVSLRQLCYLYRLVTDRRTDRHRVRSSALQSACCPRKRVTTSMRRKTEISFSDNVCSIIPKESPCWKWIRLRLSVITFVPSPSPERTR